MMQNFGAALDQIQEASELLNLVIMTCQDTDSGHLYSIRVACEISREKINLSLEQLEPHWTASVMGTAFPEDVAKGNQV